MKWPTKRGAESRFSYALARAADSDESLSSTDPSTITESLLEMVENFRDTSNTGEFARTLFAAALGHVGNSMNEQLVE